MKKIIIGVIGILSLFYIVSCSSTEDTSPEDVLPKIASPANFRQIPSPCPKSTTVDLAWEATPEAISYKLYRDGREIANVPTPTNSYTDTGLTPGTGYTYKVQACSTNGCSSDSIRKVTTYKGNNFGSIIEVGRTPADLDGYDERSREIFSHYGGNTSLMAKYLKPSGSGDGSSFDKASGNLRTVLSGITDAAANKVYVVIVTGGTYNLDGSTANIAMKSHVAIVGGLDRCLDPSKSPTVLHGGGVQSVFINNGNGLNNTALLYDVSVVKGNRVDSSGGGGGMYNNNVSPSLVRVIFSENYSAFDGGAMHNVGGSPRLTKVSFFSNEGGNYGGAMANHNSSPILEEVIFLENKSPKLYGGAVFNQGGSPSFNNVVFSNNTGKYGGAVYNQGGSASYVDVTFSGNTATEQWAGAMFNGLYYTGTLINVTFSGNTAETHGGAMYNNNSTLILIGTTFTGNTAKSRGGAMYNDNNTKDEYAEARGIKIYNSIFWGNNAPTGPEIYLDTSSDNAAASYGVERVAVYRSIIPGGHNNIPSNPIMASVNTEGFVSGGGDSQLILEHLSTLSGDDPRLFSLANNGGFVPTHAIPSTSPAVNQGIYVRRKDNTFYYSVNNTAWYNTPALIGQAVTPPADAVDLTATDATGYTRTGRPDLGAYEYR